MTTTLNIKEFPRIEANYRFIRAKQWDIAHAVCRHDDSRLWTPREAYESLQKKGEAVQIWLEILKAGVPSFAHLHETHNLVPNVLRHALATLISGTTVQPTFKANYLALGTGSNAPAMTDTQLQNEVLRSLFDNRYAAANVAFLNKFFTQAEVAGQTFSEAAIFVDGAAGANTGWPLSIVSLNESIGATETLTVNASITVN